MLPYLTNKKKKRNILDILNFLVYDIINVNRVLVQKKGIDGTTYSKCAWYEWYACFVHTNIEYNCKGILSHLFFLIFLAHEKIVVTFSI